jgi:predicted nucleic acid-binding protein
VRTIYFDASVALRWALRQPNFLDIAALDAVGVVSTLVRTECWRTLDRKRHEKGMTIQQRDEHEASLNALFQSVQEVDLTRAVLRRAALPLAAPVGTLDAMHLATALLWRELRGEDIEFATHDRDLAQAARLYGFPVIGV